MPRDPRKCLVLAAWLLTTVGATAAPPLIQVTARPARPDANLLSNADLSAHDADRPTGWEFTTAAPENFATGWAAEGHTAPGSLHLLTRTGAMSGYWGQPVAVTPGDKLMVQAWVRMTGGKLLVYLTGSPLRPDGTRDKFDQRYEAQSMKTFFLSPTWIRQEYLRGPEPDEWFLVHKAITIPAGMDALSVKLGSYFAAGEMWVDDIYCGPALVDLDVTVTGEGITRVEIMSIPGPEPVRDIPDLGGVERWTGGVQGLDAALDLIVRVTTADGTRSAARVFPNPRGIY